jgi:DNA-directed RNA polymerase specialized sigma24 family protein
MLPLRPDSAPVVTPPRSLAAGPSLERRRLDAVRLAVPTLRRGQGDAAADGRCLDEALPALRQDLRAPLHGLFYRYHIPAQDAEDLLQDAMLQAVRSWGEIRQPRQWFLGTVQTLCFRYWRERWRYEQRFEAPDARAGPAGR